MEKTYCKTCDLEGHPEVKICPDCSIEEIKNKKKALQLQRYYPA